MAIMAWSSARMVLPSTWRVVPGLGATWPKRLSRSRVLSREVLPALLWPTTAMARGASVMALCPRVGRRAAMGRRNIAEADNGVGGQANGGRQGEPVLQAGCK